MSLRRSTVWNHFCWWYSVVHAKYMNGSVVCCISFFRILSPLNSRISVRNNVLNISQHGNEFMNSTPTPTSKKNWIAFVKELKQLYSFLCCSNINYLTILLWFLLYVCVCLFVLSVHVDLVVHCIGRYFIFVYICRM